MTINVSLTPKQEARVRERVKSGEYISASEVIRTALRLLDQQERLRAIQIEELREEVMLGMRQAESGDVEPFDEKAVADIKKRGRNRLKASRE